MVGACTTGRWFEHMGSSVDANAARAALGNRVITKRRRTTAGSRSTANASCALEACAWNTAVAAERFGVNRSTIYRRMWRCGIASRSGDLRDLRGTDANLHEAHANDANGAAEASV